MINPKKLQQYILKLPGLVGYWPFDGVIAQNIAPRATINGTVNNVTVSQPGVNDRMRKPSFSFNGIDSNVVFTSFSVPTTNLSVGFFYKRDGTQDVNDRIVDWQDSGPENGFTFVHPSSNINLFVLETILTPTQINKIYKMSGL